MRTLAFASLILCALALALGLAGSGVYALAQLAGEVLAATGSLRAGRA
jgi:hypothetical protein